MSDELKTAEEVLKQMVEAFNARQIEQQRLQQDIIGQNAVVKYLQEKEKTVEKSEVIEEVKPDA